MQGKIAWSNVAVLLLLYTAVSQKTVSKVLKMGIFFGYPLTAMPVPSSSSWDKQKKQSMSWLYLLDKIVLEFYPHQETMATMAALWDIVLIWSAYGQAYYRAKPALQLTNLVAFFCLYLLGNVRNIWKSGAASSFTSLPCVWVSFASLFRILPPHLLFVEAEKNTASWFPWGHSAAELIINGRGRFYLH